MLAAGYSWCSLSRRFNLPAMGVPDGASVEVSLVITLKTRFDSGGELEVWGGFEQAMMPGFHPNVFEGRSQVGCMQPEEKGFVMAHFDAGQDWTEHVLEGEAVSGGAFVLHVRGKDSQFWSGHYGSMIRSISLVLKHSS